MKYLNKGLVILVLVMLCLVGGCATVPPGSPELRQKSLKFTPPPGMASVYVYRPYLFLGSPAHYVISLDYREFGSLGMCTYLFGNVNPGPHVIRATSNLSMRATKFDAEADKLYFFKVTHGFSIMIDPVDEKEGRDRVSKYTLSGDNIFELEDNLKK